MNLDIQKANMWKRISAGLFDGILLVILAVCFATVLSFFLGYDSYKENLDAYYAQYETEYGMTFNITQEQYDAMTQAEKDTYTAALDALSSDPEAIYSYNMLFQLSLVITIIGILLSHMVLEFAVPMFLKNGRTLGKKIFGIALMRTSCVKVSVVSLFIRTLLGKYTIEVMIPVLIIMMVFLGAIGIIGPIIVGCIGLVQVILLALNQNNALIHDLLADTVVVDMESQMIFDTEADLIEHKKKLHAERSANQVY